jgi:hypothetical protein
MDKCKARVQSRNIWDDFHPRTCSRKAVKDGFCLIHHPEEETKREKLRGERYKAPNPYYRAMDRIGELEREVEELKSKIISYEIRSC